MSNDGMNLYLFYFTDPGLLPLPVWLSYKDSIECLKSCVNPRKIVLIGSFVDGQFVPHED